MCWPNKSEIVSNFPIVMKGGNNNEANIIRQVRNELFLRENAFVE